MKVNTDLRKVLKKEHQEKWVALTKSQNKVVGYSARLADLTKKMGKKDVVYLKVLRSDTEYAF